MRWKKFIVLFVVSIENLRILRYQTFPKKILVHSIICSEYDNEDEKIFKEESIKILKIIGLKEWLKKT